MEIRDFDEADCITICAQFSETIPNLYIDIVKQS